VRKSRRRKEDGVVGGMLEASKLCRGESRGIPKGVDYDLQMGILVEDSMIWSRTGKVFQYALL
jgi:hypothetical protein